MEYFRSSSIVLIEHYERRVFSIIYLYTLLSLSLQRMMYLIWSIRKQKSRITSTWDFDIHHQAPIEKNMSLDTMSMEKADDMNMFP